MAPTMEGPAPEILSNPWNGVIVNEVLKESPSGMRISLKRHSSVGSALRPLDPQLETFISCR